MANDRVIFHIDVNSAFLSWESVKRLKNNESVDLRTIPSVIGGDESSRHGVVLAKSIHAQKYGIRTGESIFSARQKCPNLTVAPSDFPLYTKMSSELFRFLNDYSPVVEQFSIDEGFLDYTGLSKLYGEPVSAAHKLKEDIKHTFGFTVNIGISSNKILAKMAGELKKPDLVHTMFLNEIAQKLWPQPVGSLFMVGEKSKRLLNINGINTIGQLACSSPETMAKLLKSHGLLIWRYANGIDNSPVTANAQAAFKSYSNSITLSHDATTYEESYLTILKLCQSVCMRLRSDCLLCSTLSVQIKYSDFTVYSKQMHIKEATDSTDVIYKYLKELFDRLWTKAPIRLLGVNLSDLSLKSDDQISIFESLELERQKKLDKVCDTIRNQFGNHAITYGAELSGEDTGHLDRFFPNNVKGKENKD